MVVWLLAFVALLVLVLVVVLLVVAVLAVAVVVVVLFVCPEQFFFSLIYWHVWALPCVCNVCCSLPIRNHTFNTLQLPAHYSVAAEFPFPLAYSTCGIFFVKDASTFTRKNRSIQAYPYLSVVIHSHYTLQNQHGTRKYPLRKGETSIYKTTNFLGFQPFVFGVYILISWDHRPGQGYKSPSEEATHWTLGGSNAGFLDLSGSIRVYSQFYWDFFLTPF